MAEIYISFFLILQFPKATYKSDHKNCIKETNFSNSPIRKKIRRY